MSMDLDFIVFIRKIGEPSHSISVQLIRKKCDIEAHFVTCRDVINKHSTTDIHYDNRLHEIEAGTASGHTTLNSERQDGSSLQIIVKLEVLNCILLYQTHFQTPKGALCKLSCMKERLGPHVIKVFSREHVKCFKILSFQLDAG